MALGMCHVFIAHIWARNIAELCSQNDGLLCAVSRQMLCLIHFHIPFAMQNTQETPNHHPQVQTLLEQVLLAQKQLKVQSATI
jgi:hypothetical protein